jgi:hypothetical protein
MANERIQISHCWSERIQLIKKKIKKCYVVANWSWKHQYEVMLGTHRNVNRHIYIPGLV